MPYESEKTFERLNEPEKVERFYRDVCGWDVVSRDEGGGWIVKLSPNDEHGIPAESTSKHKQSPKHYEELPPMIGQIRVPNIDSCIARMEASRPGSIIGGKEEIGEVRVFGWQALCQDPAGNLFLLYEQAEHPFGKSR